MHQHEYPITKMCQVLKVSRGGYYSWLSRPVSARAKENQKLVQKIKDIHTASGGVYGSPRITDALLDEKIIVSRPRVARLMKKNGIKAKTQRKFKVTTNSDHKYSISPNLLKQRFIVEQPKTIWVSDITYISTGEGWLYLTVVIDLYNRQVVGWSMSNTLKASETTIPALEHACGRFKVSAGLIFHSDKGIQYACNDFRERLSKFQMIQSMSATGNCYDNAAAESFFSTLKKECVYQFNYSTRWQARQSIFAYIEIFYNRIRKHSFLGNKSPQQFLKLNNAA